MFSGHVETLILNFSPASATKVQLPGRGRGEGMGYFNLGAPTSKYVATALLIHPIKFCLSKFQNVFFWFLKNMLMYLKCSGIVLDFFYKNGYYTLSGLIFARIKFRGFADFYLFREIKSTRNVEFAQNMSKNKGNLIRTKNPKSCIREIIYVRKLIHLVMKNVNVCDRLLLYRKCMGFLLENVVTNALMMRPVNFFC